MPDLQRYHTQDLMEILRKQRDRLADSARLPLYPLIPAENLVFRDDQGAYWCFDLHRETWWRFQTQPVGSPTVAQKQSVDDLLGGAWQAETQPPETLEGLAELVFHLLPTTDAVERVSKGLFEPAPPPTTGHPADPVWTLMQMVALVREAYLAGQISTSSVSYLLNQKFLLESSGRVWTLGFLTNTWYTFEASQWHASLQPPKPTELVRYAQLPATCPACGKPVRSEGKCGHCGKQLDPELLGATEQTYRGLGDYFLFGAGWLPEEPAQPWRPPLGLPYPGLQTAIRCQACQAPNPPGSCFCTRCGRDLETAPVSRPTAEPIVAAAQPAPYLQICSSCGAQVGAGKRFCTQCGASLTQSSQQPQSEHSSTKSTAPESAKGKQAEPPPADRNPDTEPGHIICPTCKAHVVAGKNFCTQCGARLPGPQ